MEFRRVLFRSRGGAGTPRVADAGGGSRLLLWLRERGAVAALPHRACPPDLPHVRLGALCQREPDVRPCRGAGVDDPRPGRAGPRLPLRALAEDDPGVAAGGDDRRVLAHSLAEPGSVRDLPLARGTARRPAW